MLAVLLLVPRQGDTRLLGLPAQLPGPPVVTAQPHGTPEGPRGCRGLSPRAGLQPGMNEIRACVTNGTILAVKTTTLESMASVKLGHERGSSKYRRPRFCFIAL